MSYRDLGYGKASMEEAIGDQVHMLMDRLESQILDKPADIRGQFNIAVLNSLWTVLTGEQVDIGDSKMNKIVNLMDEALRSSGETLRQLASVYPVFNDILDGLKVYRFNYIWGYVTKSIQETVSRLEGQREGPKE